MKYKRFTKLLKRKDFRIFVFVLVVTSNVLIFSTNITLAENETWETYRNDEYGFEIKYPNNFIIILENAPNEVLKFEVNLVNPFFPKKMYDCCYTKDEIEKYGEKPEISIQVIAPYFKKILSPRATELKNELEKKGIPTKVAYYTVSTLPSHGEHVKNKVIWVDGCNQQDLLKVNDAYFIKSQGCVDGIVTNTIATFVSQRDYVIRIYDTASEYAKAGLFDPIVSTFQFTKRLPQGDAR